MGIYPELTKSTVQFNHHTGEQTWTEYRQTPGLVEQRTVTATRWEVKERTDCFCCSCDDERPGSDPACRNHGWAAQRPCDTHNLPGQPWDDTGNPSWAGKMPDSVQQYRAGNKSN